MKNWGDRIKNPANLITWLRIPLSAGMLLAAPFSAAFWGCYLCAGASDLLDGLVARRLGCQSARGARLDSAADLVFAAALAVFALTRLRLPAWLRRCAAAVAALRLSAYGVGLVRFRRFSALHTWANKAAGALLFAGPALCRLLGLRNAGVLLCAVSGLSAAEELAITLHAPALDRDRRSLLCP